MSNIPSLPDLETDEASLFFTEDFQTQLFLPKTESDEYRETPEKVMAGENSSDGLTKGQPDYRSIFPDTGNISGAASESVSHLLLSQTKEDEEDKAKVDSTQMTVSKERKEDRFSFAEKISARTTPHVDIETANESSYDNLNGEADKTEVDGTQITVAMERKEDCCSFAEKISTRTTPHVDMDNESSYDNLSPANPVLEEFKMLAISKADYTERIETADSFDDLEELEMQDEDGDTLLHQAIILESPCLATVLIQIMFQNGLDLNVRNLLFQTPIHLALLTEQVALVQELVKNGSDVSIRDKNGRTPVHVACEKRRPDLVDNLLVTQERRLLKKGSGISQPGNVLDIKNYDGEGCVHIAAKFGDIDLMKCLIRHGANVNLADEKSGRTALHFAAEYGDKDLVKYLLGIRNVNLSPETLNGETPILLAYLRDFDEIVELFKEQPNT